MPSPEYGADDLGVAMTLFDDSQNGLFAVTRRLVRTSDTEMLRFLGLYQACHTAAFIKVTELILDDKQIKIPSKAGVLARLAVEPEQSRVDHLNSLPLAIDFEPPRVTVKETAAEYEAALSDGDDLKNSIWFTYNSNLGHDLAKFMQAVFPDGYRLEQL